MNFSTQNWVPQVITCNQILPNCFSYTVATPSFSPLSCTLPDTPSPTKDDQLEHDFSDFIQHQQQISNTDRQLSIHQLTHSASPSETSTPSIRNTPKRAQRILMKRKYPTNPPRYLINRPSSSRVPRVIHPRNTNTSELLLENLPLFPPI